MLILVTKCIISGGGGGVLLSETEIQLETAHNVNVTQTLHRLSITVIYQWMMNCIYCGQKCEIKLAEIKCILVFYVLRICFHRGVAFLTTQD